MQGKSPPLLKKIVDVQKVEQLRTTALKEGNVQIDWSLRLNDMQSPCFTSLLILIE